MKRLPAHWVPHSVRVRPFRGAGGAGPIYGEPYTLRPEDERGVYVEDVREVLAQALCEAPKPFQRMEESPLAAQSVIPGVTESAAGLRA